MTAHTILLMAGPPLSGAMWAQVQKRLQLHGLDVRIIALLEPPDITTAAQAAQRVAAIIADTPSPLLVAHGLAVPVALHAAQHSPPAGLVLSNGPIAGVDRVSALLGQLPASVLQSLLQPRLWLRYLASSAGLRRAVVNPYVMDRDTVVAVCGPPVRTAAHRSALAAVWRDLAHSAEPPPAFPGPTLLVWGDQDRLYPMHISNDAAAMFPCLQRETVPGGQHLHPLERPWAIADAIWNWSRQELTAT